MNMNIRALAVFVTVAREGSLTRAAEKLHLTQPAVGLQIKSLQAQTGLRLLSRTAQGMRLTHDGAILLPLAEKVLQAESTFKTAASRLHHEVRGSLKIGTILDPEFTRLGALFKELLGSANHIEIMLSHGMSGDVRNRVEHEELDAGFYLSAPTARNTAKNQEYDANPGAAANLISMKELTRFTYRVVAPAGWEPQIHGRDWPELSTLPWLATPPASVHHRLLAQVFGTNLPTGSSMKSVAMVDQEASMLDLVKSGAGLSLIRDHIAIREAQAHGLVVSDTASLDCLLSFVYLTKRADDPPVVAVLAALAKVWPNAKKL